MNIVLNVTETERWSVLTQCIEGELCLAEEIESEKGNGTYVVKDTCPLPLVEKLLSEKRPNKIVIFYQQAEVYIAESINDGMPIASASEQWLLKIQKLIEIQKRNRSKIILINAEQACTEVGRLNQLLNNSGISFIENIEIKEIAETFFLLLAAHFVVQQKNIKIFNFAPASVESSPATKGNKLYLIF
ncbi:hypothetical protein [Neptunomonas phycophila]|uniref:hypothetical protein n=1 Tax=Neptunomonas phycophila TaxID=1572645 RepID=UPI0015C08A55|nr:hypothetical protein [Neptunomonas phycophila]QLE96767.1 hypothetical protein FLM49_03580 [Neptunomonas phycophila]